MSVDAMAWALRQQAGSAATKCVLLVLADVADADGVSWYGQKLLAKRAEVGVRTLRDHLSKLVARGLLERRARSRDNGSRTTDLYRLCIEKRLSVCPPAEIAPPPGGIRRGPRRPTAGLDPLGEPSTSDEVHTVETDLFGGQAIAANGNGKTSAWPAKAPQNDAGTRAYPLAFEVAWKAYPLRSGPNPKLGAYRAFRAHVVAGVSPDVLRKAAENYARFCRAEKREGTVYVWQAATFWGPNEPWREFADGMPVGSGGCADADDDEVRRWEEAVARTVAERD